jgi:hypothetical protein
MLVDWATCGAIVTGRTVLINKIILGKRGASTPLLWTLMIDMSVFNVMGMTAK